jgi:hypothetical protein
VGRRLDFLFPFVCGLTIVVRQHFTDSFSQSLLSGATIKKIRVRELGTHRNSEATESLVRKGTFYIDKVDYNFGFLLSYCHVSKMITLISQDDCNRVDLHKGVANSRSLATGFCNGSPSDFSNDTRLGRLTVQARETR